MKICSQCGIEKNESEFYFRKDRNTFRKNCKKCCDKKIKDRTDKLRQEHKCLSCSKPIEEGNDCIYCISCLEKRADYLRKLVKDKKCRNCKQELDPGSNNTYCKTCLKKHNEGTRAYFKKMVEENKCVCCAKLLTEDDTAFYCKTCNERINNYRRNKYKTDIVYRLRNYFSSIINFSLRKRGYAKARKSIMQYLSYTIEDLKEHLEKQFEPWMNWNNTGNYQKDGWDDNDPSTWKWSVDHIIPQASLPYSSMEDENFKKCWALENLRPISAKENLEKGKKIL